ncbi:uncharacterized protein si:ch211-286o17.1 [Trichomycterus rosablanca]|uniref:uncharacterized protein si:ch211-286o17.1 n=1 Tax=Trichomycterus rosablanca TaxID=2290929 RepID=UPI002F3533FC
MILEAHSIREPKLDPRSLQNCTSSSTHMLSMEWNRKNTLQLVSVICVLAFQGVTCQNQTINKAAPVRGDNVLPTPAIKISETHKPQHQIDAGFPSLTNSPPVLDRNQVTFYGDRPGSPALQSDASRQQTRITCVDHATVRDSEAIKLKLKQVSSCQESRTKISSVLQLLCGNTSKLKIHQQHNTDEMILSGECIEADPKTMTEMLNNDNIKDKIGVEEAALVNNSRTVLISVLVAGLLLAALLITGYILKTKRNQAKDVHLAEEMYQVDELNQGNTLLSVAPLPPQEALEKPTSNGDSVDPPPTNGHSAPQTQVDSGEM